MFSRELNNANTVKRMADFLGHHLRIMKKIIRILCRRTLVLLPMAETRKGIATRELADGTTYTITAHLTKVLEKV